MTGHGPARYDAIVVGARCAGAPTAMLLARRGHRVLLVDRAGSPGRQRPGRRGDRASSGGEQLLAGSPATRRTLTFRAVPCLRPRPGLHLPGYPGQTPFQPSPGRLL
jgi:glycine/D-amino acid oxidase-like deaminating enzyme